MKTGVLVHGCNLHAENWRHLAWGDPPVAMGRLPQGLLTAYTHDADVIVFGSGASSKEYRYSHSPKSGTELVESEYTFEYLASHFDNLLNFKPWQDMVAEAKDVNAWRELEKKLLDRIVLDTVSQNTVEELATAGKMFVDHGVERVLLISSPTHIVRVLRDANKVYQNEYQFRQFMYSVHAVPCITCYEGSTPSDVVVIEPPHRPDRHVLPTHRRIQRMLALQKLDPTDLMHFINDFDELLQHYEELYFNGHMPARIPDAPPEPQVAPTSHPTPVQQTPDSVSPLPNIESPASIPTPESPAL